ncbi:hypothetical protein, partial [Lentilactobacillus hilgardii]|uniref:hypothetical protein n=1 Tax=Lentilactobacillus hilgardii TaxID=1588 RepID=UPI001C6585FA
IDYWIKILLRMQRKAPLLFCLPYGEYGVSLSGGSRSFVGSSWFSWSVWLKAMVLKKQFSDFC